MQNKQPSEKDWAGNLLYMHKMEATTLCTAALESTNNEVRGHITAVLNKSLQNQKQLFDFMSSKGWYTVETAPREEYNRIQQTMTNMQSQQQ